MKNVSSPASPAAGGLVRETRLVNSLPLRVLARAVLRHRDGIELLEPHDDLPCLGMAREDFSGERRRERPVEIFRVLLVLLEKLIDDIAEPQLRFVRRRGRER